MASHDQDEELAVLLTELERTLSDLRSAVGEDVRRRRRGPPTPGDIIRFTEEYTIPTLVALLDATARSLELLRAVLRVAGPGGGDASGRTRLEDAETADVTSLRNALADLRTALGGANLPEDSAARGIITDARSLTAEIDERLAETATEGPADTEWAPREREREYWRDRRRTDDGGGVTIDVREESGEDGVDVDAELSSIKESMEPEDDQEESDET